MSTENKKDNTDIKTIHLGTRPMWCENCGGLTYSSKTTLRIYRGGKEVQLDKCEDCNKTQETEYFKGPSTRIQNKDEV